MVQNIFLIGFLEIVTLIITISIFHLSALDVMEVAVLLFQQRFNRGHHRFPGCDACAAFKQAPAESENRQTVHR